MSLVIGAAGAVGKRLVAGLLERGDQVIAGLRNTPLPKEMASLVVASEFGVDVRNTEKLESIFQRHPNIHTVWNLAAPLSVETAANPDLAMQVTVGGMRNLTQIMEKHNVPKLMFTDSIGSFGTTAPRLDCTARWLTENPTQDPGSDYGLQKRACREIMKEFASRGGDTRFAVLPGVLHSSSTWGNGTTEYALDAMRVAALGGHYTCPVDPETTMPMIYVEDLVRGMLALVDAPKEDLLEPEGGYVIPGLSFNARQLFEEIRKHEPNFSFDVQLNPNMDKFSRTWPDTLSLVEPLRDLKYAPRTGLSEMVEIVMKAHYARNAAGMDDFSSVGAL